MHIPSLGNWYSVSSLQFPGQSWQGPEKSWKETFGYFGAPGYFINRYNLGLTGKTKDAVDCIFAFSR
jgi:hypothetical protein